MNRCWAAVDTKRTIFVFGCIVSAGLSGNPAQDPIQAVKKGLAWEAPLLSQSILVFRDMGYVWLTGEVASEEEKKTAGCIARRALGRRFVLKNCIHVRNRSEASFRTAVQDTKIQLRDAQISLTLFSRLLRRYGTGARSFRFQIRTQILEIFVPEKFALDWEKQGHKILGDLKIRRVVRMALGTF